MRAFCTVSAPLEVCASSAETLSPGSRFLALRLLGNQQPKTLYFLVDAKSRVREVYTQTCLHFATQGMLDTELFGLAVLIDGEYMFADPESKLSKYGPKSWRSSHTHGLDANGRPLLELHFRVQFYIESPFMLKDETSKHNYYLQLKYNALQRDAPKEYSDQSMILLAGLALQADLGDAALSVATGSATSTRTASHGLSHAALIGNTTTTTTTTTTATATATAKAAVTKNSNNNGRDVNSESSVTKTNSQQATFSTPTTNVKSKTLTTTTTTLMTTTTTTTKTKTMTTLPKINKRISSEKVLRLSTFISTASLSHATTTLTATATSTSASTASASSAASASSSSTTTTSTLATSSTSSAAVFPISCSPKRSFNAAPATLSPSLSSSSINRSASLSANSSAPAFAAAGPSPVAPPSQIDYFRLEEYLPLGLRTAWAASALRACHREHHGMSSADAELHYIQQACLLQESINAHTFRMRMSKNELGPGSSWFVVYAKGIKVQGIGDNPQQQITFLWPNITKLSFERKKFEIRSGDNKITLFASSDEKNKMLLTLCKETHQFSMKIAARLKEVVKREEEESNCLHACYIYSRSLHLPYKNKNDQRISVISSTSSNTTSGIVSDRVHSEDELEIMINTPPAPIAAPSTESLALAHLLDRPSVSRQTSSVGQVSLKELEDHLVALTVRQQQQQQQQQRQCSSSSSADSPTELSNASTVNSSTSSSFPTTSPRSGDSLAATESPSSQHNVGSQCSSTCSTVVVASPSDCNSASSPLSSLVVNSASNAPITRRNSTSSSLELGFSHTAQNSVLSEIGSTCVEHGYIHTTTGNEETESISGVYTLAHGVPRTETSGVYTMHSSEMTGQSSEIAESESQASSHYGIFQPSLKSVISDDEHLRSELSTLDSVDGGGSVTNYHSKRIKSEKFRLRSDSNISASGSFRGDGSDPTDSKHTLLSAEELTELIVGRGTYPCRQTAANALDSDCDYVTLPLSLQGASYIAGHQDTAPTDDHVVDDLMDVLLPADPPAPPQRIESNALNREALANLSHIRLRSPPPYNARHEKTGLCGPPVRQISQTGAKPAAPAPPTATSAPNVPSMSEGAPPTTSKDAAARTSATVHRREPPPYPVSAKPRPTSLVSLTSSTTSSSSAAPPPLLSTVTDSMSSLKSEEITARFITTRPQINILKAHTSVVSEHSKPSYAAPTFCSTPASSSAAATARHHHVSSQLSQQSALNSNYAGSSIHQFSSLHHSHRLQHPPPPVPIANPSQMSAAAAAHVAAAAAAGAGVIPNTVGIPLVPYSLHATHKSMSSLHQQPPPPPPPYGDLKPAPRTCVLLPVIKPRQYLPPPPPSLPRQPPPPPPPQLATVYTSQLAHKQLELYQQQLYSDVDYVIYPIQDPAVSQQEYLDAKQSSLLAAMAQSPPPPHPYLAYHHHAAASAHAGAWDACKGHAIYRSTPYLPLALSTHSRYASTQNLSDTYVQIPGTYSPLYSPSVASLCSSYEPPPPPPLLPAALAVASAGTSSLFARSRSDDNILNSLDSLPKVKRLPPPPPPPYVNRRLKKPPMPTPTEKPPPIPSKPISQASPQRSNFPPLKPPTLSTTRSKSHMTKTSSGAQWAGERPKPDSVLSRVGGAGSSSILAHLQASVAAAKSAASQSDAVAAANAIDIALLREKSKNLDLPLISALCNDRSLLKQTKAFVPPKSGRNAATSTMTTSATADVTAAATATAATATANGNHYTSKSLALGSAATSANVNNSTPPSQQQQQLQQQPISGANGAANTTATLAAASGKFAAGSITKPRKTSVSHRHPNDKLPPLPMQMAEANNYVMDPAILKHHKGYNSQT